MDKEKTYKTIMEQKDDDEIEIDDLGIPDEYKPDSGEAEPKEPEEDKPEPETKPSIEKELPGEDKPMRSYQLGREISKDVRVNAAVLKEDYPLPLEIYIEFSIQPTNEFIAKHRQIKTYKDKSGVEKEKYGELYFADVRHILENRFGLGALKRDFNVIKEKLDKQYENDLPIWKWADIPLVYRDSEGPRDFWQPGLVYNKSWGMDLRFDIDKKVRVGKDIIQIRPSDTDLNKYYSHKAELFKKAIVEMPRFKSDADFKISPQLRA